MSIIDPEGFRESIGIVLVNHQKRLLLAKRSGKNAWQFPQGGVLVGEDPEEAMFRELKEEVGLSPHHVHILHTSRRWLTYRLPRAMIRYERLPLCLGQKQKWFLLEFLGDETDICLDTLPQPEFDDWRWVSYWYPLKEVIEFKKQVYRKVLQEFVPWVFQKTEQPCVL